MRTAQLASVLISLSVPATAQETAAASDVDPDSRIDVTLLAGTEFVSGKFDGQEYETVSVNGGFFARSGQFFLSTAIPYLVTTAPQELIVSNGGVLGTPLLAQPSLQTRQVTREGIGDLVVQGGYLFPIGGMNASIAGNLKVPTASRDNALGTGEVDYGITGQVSRQFGRMIPFATASYTIIGEPEGFDVQDTLAGTVGSHVLLGDASSVTVAYSYEEAATTNIGGQQSVGVSLEAGLSPRFQMGLDARAGLSREAPDARVGVRIGLGF